MRRSLSRNSLTGGGVSSPTIPLAHSEMSITEIAYTIGFADPSNFSRSCVRSFGVSPASYRRRIRGVQT